MERGMHIDNATLIEVLSVKVADAAVREAQMEAAIQSLLEQQNELMQQKGALYEQITDLEQKLNPREEVIDASSDIQAEEDRASDGAGHPSDSFAVVR